MDKNEFKMDSDNMKYCFWGRIYNGLIGMPIGGGELQLSLIVKHLNALGRQICVIDFDTEKDIELNGIKIISLKKRLKSKKYLSKYVVLFVLLKEANADVYYARIRSSIHLLGWFVAQQNKGKFVYHVASDLDTYGFKERWKGFYSKGLLRTFFVSYIHDIVFSMGILKRADLIVAQHAEQVRNLKKRGVKNIIEAKNLFEFSPNNSFNKQHKDPNITRQKFFVIVGSLDRRKGIIPLKKLISTNPSNQFIVIGKARDKYGEKFIQDIKSCNNALHIKHVEHSKVFEFIAESTGVISTSLNEGFSNVFLEAWSLGVPVFSLYVNPSNVINNYKLGKCYDGDISRMVSDLKNQDVNFNRNEIINYVKEFHDPVLNCKTINDCIKGTI